MSCIGESSFICKAVFLAEHESRPLCLALPECKFQGLTDVALVWNAAAAGSRPNGVQQLIGDSEVYRLPLGSIFKWKRRKILGIDVFGQVLFQQLLRFLIAFERGQSLAHIFRSPFHA